MDYLIPEPVKLGVIYEIPLGFSYVNFLFLPYYAYLLSNHIKERNRLFLFVLFTELLKFSSFFLHELGHAFATIVLGGTVHKIVLQPLGAFTSFDPKQTSSESDALKARALIFLAGPLVDILLISLSFLILRILFKDKNSVKSMLLNPFNPRSRESSTSAPWIIDVSHQIVHAWSRSLVINLLINLTIPMYPKDAGNLLAVFMKYLGIQQRIAGIAMYLLTQISVIFYARRYMWLDLTL
jgi:Zn-dependent protease